MEDQIFDDNEAKNNQNFIRKYAELYSSRTNGSNTI